MNFLRPLLLTFLMCALCCVLVECESGGDSQEEDEDSKKDGKKDDDGSSEKDGGTTEDGGSDSDSDTDSDSDDVLFSVDCEISSEINTVGIVTWSVDKDSVSEAYIDFGLDTDYGMRAPVDLDEAGYRTLLLGMKGSSLYHFRITVKDGDNIYTSGDYTVSTGPVTNLANIKSMTIDNEEARAGGFIVTSLFQDQTAGITGKALAFIVDADGDVVWWYLSELPNVTRARMSYDGKRMWMVTTNMVGASGLEWVTMDGLESQVFEGNATHDITAVTGDVMAYPAGDCTRIVEITPDGTRTEIYDTNQIWKGMCHANAIRYSETEGVYTLSDMLQQDVIMVDRAAGSLVWRLSDFNFSWTGHQHGHHLLDDSIVMFVNTTGSTPEFSLDGDSMQGVEIWRYDCNLNSTVLGDVQRLPNGNTMVTYSTAARIHEVDANSERVMEIRFDSTIGFSLWRESLYGPPDDVLL